jgi:hypothetical protein
MNSNEMSSTNSGVACMSCNITVRFVNYEFPRKMIEFLMQYAFIFEVTIAVRAPCLPISPTTKNDAHHLTEQCHSLHPISDV